MRLAVFAAFLLGLFYLVAVARIIDVEQVRRLVAATGPAAPLTYVVVSAVLGEQAGTTFPAGSAGRTPVMCASATTPPWACAVPSRE